MSSEDILLDRVGRCRAAANFWRDWRSWVSRMGRAGGRSASGNPRLERPPGSAEERPLDFHALANAFDAYVMDPRTERICAPRTAARCFRRHWRAWRTGD